MSIERLALVIGCTLVLVSAIGIAYLTAEQMGAIRQTDLPAAPHPIPGVVPPEPSAQSALSRVNRVTAHALVGGAFRAGPLARVPNGAEKAILTQRSE